MKFLFITALREMDFVLKRTSNARKVMTMAFTLQKTKQWIHYWSYTSICIGMNTQIFSLLIIILDNVATRKVHAYINRIRCFSIFFTTIKPKQVLFTWLCLIYAYHWEMIILLFSLNKEYNPCGMNQCEDNAHSTYR